MTRVAHAGVGGWGKNVVRVVGELADLAWVCDTDPGRQAEYAARYPAAHITASFDDLVGFPYPDEAHSTVRFLETPATVWGARTAGAP